MTGTEVFIIVALVLGVAAVLASVFISESTFATKKEKQKLEEKEAKAKEEFDKYLETQMEEIKAKIEKYETETFSTLTKNASHDIEVVANEAVEKIGNRTDEVKKQLDELFDNAKKELETLDAQYVEKLDERNKEANEKAEEILDKALKDLELVKEDAANMVASLEKSCYERADKAAKDAIDELDIITVFKELYEKSTLHRKGEVKETPTENSEEISVKDEKNISPESEDKKPAEADEKDQESISKEASESEAEETSEAELSEISKKPEEEPADTSDSDEDKEESKSCVEGAEEAIEDLNVIEAVIQANDVLEKDQEIIEIKDLAKQFEEMDFEVTDEDIEKIKEKENLTNDKKTGTMHNLSEADEIEKTKILPKIEEEFVYVEEEITAEIPEQKQDFTEDELVIEDVEELEIEPVAEEIFEEAQPEEEPEEESMLFKVMRENDIFSSDIDETLVSEVLKMNKKRKTSMQISKELGIGIAEVRTIIDLFSE